MMIECPHCHMETEHKVIDHINIDRNPELRAKVQDLSVFRVKCPNCGETVLAVHPCLYHDMANQFMVWLWTEDGQVPKAEFDPLAGYTLRVTDSLNTFREKINILERGLDDRTIEIMKLLLFAQLNRDLDVVELLFHELDERTGDFRFVARAFRRRGAVCRHAGRGVSAPARGCGNLSVHAGRRVLAH